MLFFMVFLFLNFIYCSIIYFINKNIIKFIILMLIVLNINNHITLKTKDNIRISINLN